MNNSVIFTIGLKDAISSGIKDISGLFSKLSGQVSGTTDETQKFNNVCSKLKFSNLNAQLQVLGQMASAFSSLTDAGISFGQSMADLSAITGIVGTDLDQLTSKAREFGKQSGLGANTAARAYTILASQIEVSKIGMDGLNNLEEQSIVLAQAAGMSIDDAATSMAGTINQFGISASEAARVVNVLAAGSKYGAAEIDALSQSFKVVG